eukprot:XP_025980466.1 uncharacterized protein LOC100807916 [Glycine max]
MVLSGLYYITNWHNEGYIRITVSFKGNGEKQSNAYRGEIRRGSGTRPHGNRIEPAPTLTNKNRVDRVRGRVRLILRCYSLQLSVLTPHIAKPLAGKKLCKRTLKLVHRAAEHKCLKRGVKEVVKSIRRGHKGLCVIAGNISPIDVITHVPILCEESDIPYIYVSSKEVRNQLRIPYLDYVYVSYVFLLLL